MSKYNRVPLKTRLHFLFTGEIKDFWYVADRMVKSTYLEYLMQRYPDLKKEKDFDEEEFGAITKFLNKRIAVSELKPHIFRPERKSHRLYDYLPEHFTD